MKSIKENETIVANHLRRLSEAGLIDYDSRKVNTPITQYRLADNTAPGQDLSVYRNLRTLSTAVYEILRVNAQEYLTANDVMNLLPQELTKNRTNKRKLSTISSVLKNLEKEGWAQIEKFESKTQSEIKLSEEQQAVISELVEILEKFEDQDPQILEEGRRLAFEILNDPKRVSQLMQIAREASSHANQWSQAKTFEIISSIVSAHPGITNKELRDIIGHQEDKHFSIKSISELTSSLSKQRQIRVVIEGVQQRFFPKE